MMLLTAVLIDEHAEDAVRRLPVCYVGIAGEADRMVGSLGTLVVGALRHPSGSATRRLGYHVTVTDLSGEAASPLFRIVTNPNPFVRP
jgi:hypothetical protein